MSKLSSIKYITGAVIVVIGVLMISGNLLIQPVPKSETFASEPIQISGFELQSADTGEIPQKLIIPDLNIFIDVRESGIVDGYWQVFEDSAGWGKGSGLPGEIGNQVIFAHAREGLFAPLRKIESGMRIFILTESSWFEYEVELIDEVFPGDTKYIQQSDQEILTLYTCSGYQDSKRLIVVAKPV